MSIVSKSVLQLTRSVIHEDDKEEFFDILNQARHGIHWELETPEVYSNSLKYMYVLRYFQKEKRWAVFMLYGYDEKELCSTAGLTFFKKYEEAKKVFNDWCDLDQLDKSTTKRTKPVFGTQ